MASDEVKSENEDDFDVFISQVQSVTCSEKDLEFGILFDIDGVLARGLNPLPQAQEMMNLLKGPDKNLRVPIAFVTNGCAKVDTKAALLSKWFDTKVTCTQAIHSQSPFSVFTHWHKRHVLFIGQGDVRGIASDLGFTNVCTLDDIANCYPLLDMVDHQNRKNVAKGYVEREFPTVEAIILIGEPVKWESNLQLIVDLLITNGNPRNVPESYPSSHLPILACNMDLVFMAEAEMPRFGHGAFLCCLEALYLKITGFPLVYTSIVGKPSEITYRYAEHTLASVANDLNITAPLRKIYFVGDNPLVDIVGANLYNKYLSRFRRMSGGSLSLTQNEVVKIQRKVSVASSRLIPDDAEFNQQTVRRIESVLVGTGVYNPNGKKASEQVNHQHRDFNCDAEMSVPTYYFDDVLEAVKYILKHENVKFSN